MKEYIENITVPYFNCDKNGKIKPVSLLEYLVETSSLHSQTLGLGFNELISKDYNWILSRWKLKIDSYPGAREKIKVKTWISGFDKFYANREFNVYDEYNNLIVRASTLWIFIDMKRKRPIRIPSELYGTINLLNDKNFDDFYKFDNNLESEQSIDFKVRKTDIDYNNHVNNAKYINWLLESIPIDVDENYTLKEIDIYYKKEIKLNRTIESKINSGNKVGDKIEYIHEIFNKDIGEMATKGRTVWEKF